MEKAARGSRDPEAQYQLGVLLFRRKLHPDAVALFQRAVALRPHDARAFDFLALCYEALGEAERAEQSYKAALEVNERGSPFFDSLLDHNYGRFLLKERRLSESKPHLDRAVALLPNTRATYYERGKLNLALERYQAARDDAERALSLRDEGGLVLDVQVHYLLATVYARLGETELARKHAELAPPPPSRPELVACNARFESVERPCAPDNPAATRTVSKRGPEGLKPSGPDVPAVSFA